MRNLCKSNAIANANLKYLLEATFYAEPVIEKGEGSTVWDVDGNKYLDLNAGQFCMIFGHGYRPFLNYIADQMSKIYHTNTATLSPEVFIAAEKMASTMDYKLTKTMFLSTGSEANEAALRYAKYITGQTGVMGFDQGYHGLTLASQGNSMGGLWARPFVQDTVSVKTPDYIHSNRTVSEDEFYDICMEDLDTKFKESGDNLAAVLMEPVIGVGGMVTIPYVYLKRVRELCDQYGVVLIFDECQCGFGRSGRWYAYQKADVIPDILVTAKAMGMGMAVSAVTFSEEIASLIEGKLVHFSSHQNDPLSASIVSFVIDEINNNDLLKSNEKKGEYLKNALERACMETNKFINVRGDGLMCAFDIDDTVVTDYKGFSRRFIKEMEGNGVLIQAIRQGRTFRVMPNYYIKEEEIDFLENAVIKSAVNS